MTIGTIMTGATFTGEPEGANWPIGAGTIGFFDAEIAACAGAYSVDAHGVAVPVFRSDR